MLPLVFSILSFRMFYAGMWALVVIFVFAFLGVVVFISVPLIGLSLVAHLAGYWPDNETAIILYSATVGGITAGTWAAFMIYRDWRSFEAAANGPTVRVQKYPRM